MDWQVLGKVLFKVAVFLLSVALGVMLAGLAMVYMGNWSLLLVPLCVLYYVIKFMYQDELVRQGKRLH